MCFIRPRKRLDNWDKLHNMLYPQNVRIKANNKSEAKTKIKSELKYKLYVVEEITEL